MRLFQQCLQLVLQPRSVACELIPGAGDGAPEALHGSRHKAQGQLAGYQPLDQTFAIYEILLASAPATIRQGLRQIRVPDFGPTASRF